MTVAQRRLDYLNERPWRELTVPADAVGIPTMLSKDERRLLYALARDYADEGAAIVDAGCFLGGSTAALLAGLRDRENGWAGPPLASYDLFRVEAYTIPKFFKGAGLHVGDSFHDQFEANVAGFEIPRVVNEGDITEIGWPGGPIDVLFLDVLKTWEVNDAVLRDFFPSLRAGRSVIVHQDYGSGWVPWIPITIELMGDSLRLIDGMEWGSHVFLVQDEIPADLIRDGVQKLDPDLKFEFIDRRIMRHEGWVRGMLELGRTELVVERDGTDAGLRDLDRIAARYAKDESVVWFIDFLRQALKTNWTFESSDDEVCSPTLFGFARRQLARWRVR